MFCAWCYYDDKHITMEQIYSYSRQSNLFFPFYITLWCTMVEYVNISYTLYKIFVGSLLWKTLHNLCLVLFKVCFLAHYKSRFFFSFVWYFSYWILQNKILHALQLRPAASLFTIRWPLFVTSLFNLSSPFLCLCNSVFFNMICLFLCDGFFVGTLSSLRAPYTCWMYNVYISIYCGHYAFLDFRGLPLLSAKKF